MILYATGITTSVLTLEVRDDQKKSNKNVVFRKNETYRVSRAEFHNSPALLDAVAKGFISVAYEMEDEVYLSDIQEIIAYATPQNIINVAKNTTFSSIKTALDSIHDSGVNNRYLIRVGPGDYTEDSMTLKTYVSIQGCAEQVTAVYLKNSPTYPYLFDNNNQRGLAFS